MLRKLDVPVLEARALIALLRRKATVVTPTVTMRRSRDPDDDKFLECAVAGAADALVTADADLLTLRAIEGIPILDIPAFWRRLLDRTLKPPG